MKRLAIMLALLGFAAPARAATWEWSRADLAMETTFLAVTALDWSQTIDFTQAKEVRYRESNPFLGPFPSRARVNTYIPLAMLGHAAVAAALPHGPLRSLWQMTWIAVETKVVVTNRTTFGVGFSLPWN